MRVKKTGISQLILDAYAFRIHDWHQIPFAARYSNIRPKRDKHRIFQNWGKPFNLLYETGPGQIIPALSRIKTMGETLAPELRRDVAELDP